MRRIEKAAGAKALVDCYLCHIMSLEAHRRMLMSSSAKWGDEPPSLTRRSTLPQHNHPPQPNLVPSSDSEQSAPLLDMIRSGSSSNSRGFITSKGWTLDKLIASGESFNEVPRVSASNPDLTSSVEEHERSGIPLIIEAWHKHPKWPKDLFTPENFCANVQQDIDVRNVRSGVDRKLPLSELISKSRAISPFAAMDETERLYGKDAPCPNKWNHWLHNADVLPLSLLPDGSNNMLLHVPESERVETLMCYIGIGDTFTPCHKDLCASSGQNIMCYTEDSGSSFWFMTDSNSSMAAVEYLQKFNQELDHESYVMSVEELANAPFKVYIAEQKLGDMVLVPPRSCHQVVNHGGITIKTSWSRMTISGLLAAIHDELPIYRRVCRPETYRIKYTIYCALLSYIMKLDKLVLPRVRTDRSSSSGPDFSASTTYLPTSSSRDEPPAKTHFDRTHTTRLAEDLYHLLRLFDHIMEEEYCEDHKDMQHLHSSSSDSSSTGKCDRVTCDFCGTDIFQSFFECRDCGNAFPGSDHTPSSPGAGLGDGLVICPSCYVEGRSCRCGSMEPVQFRPFEDLLSVRRRAVGVTLSLREGGILNRNHNVIDERQLLSDERFGIFKAGCVFWKNRKTNGGTRRCRIMQGHAHDVDFLSSLVCKKCRSYRCFHHLLTSQQIHSAEALLSHHRDKQHEDWHKRHLKAETDKAKLEVAQARKTSTRLDLRHRLVEVASMFPFCHPVKPLLVKCGWYDRTRSHIADALDVELSKSNTTKVDAPKPSFREVHTLDANVSEVYVQVPPKSTLPVDAQESSITDVSALDVDTHNFVSLSLKVEPLMEPGSPLTSISSIPPSPLVADNFLPDVGYDMHFAGPLLDSDSTTPQPPTTPPTSVDSGGSKTPEIMNPLPSTATGKSSDPKTRKRPRREILEHVLITLPTSYPPKLGMNTPSTRRPKALGIRKSQSKPQKLADKDGDERITDLSRHQEHTKGLNLSVGRKTGPPKRTIQTSRKRTPPITIADKTTDQPPSKRVCVRSEISVGAREDISSGLHTKHRKEKLEPVRQTPAKMTDVIPGSSTTTKLPICLSTYRPPTILPGAERTSMTKPCPTCSRMPCNEIAGSSDPHSTPKYPISFRKPSDRKNQLIERKLREEVAQMKIEQSKMQQEHNAATLKLSKLSELEQENEELKKSLTEKEVQLRYAEDLLLRQLIEHPTKASNSQIGSPSLIGLQAGQDRPENEPTPIANSQSSHIPLVQRIGSNTNQVPPVRRETGVSEHQRFLHNPSYPRAFRGRGRGGQPYWQGLSFRRNLNHPTFEARRLYHQRSMEASGSHSHASHPIYPRRHMGVGNHRNLLQKPRQPEREDILTEPTTATESLVGNEEAAKITSPSVQCSVEERAEIISRPPSPSESSEFFWEDLYEQNQETPLVNQTTYVSNQRDTTTELPNDATDEQSVPFTMDANPWA